MRIRHRSREADGRHQRQIGCVIDDTGRGLAIDPELACEVGERGHFVAASLHEVPYAKLPHARRHGGRAPAAYRCDRDAAQHEKLDAVPIAYVKHLELLTPGREVEAPVGQDTVDIEH